MKFEEGMKLKDFLEKYLPDHRVVELAKQVQKQGYVEEITILEVRPFDCDISYDEATSISEFCELEVVNICYQHHLDTNKHSMYIVVKTDMSKNDFKTIVEKYRYKCDDNNGSCQTRNRFKIITLCGSTKFKDEFEKVAKRLTLDGNIVLTPTIFSKSDGGSLSSTELDTLVNIHKEKISMCDEIYVINKCGYIGRHTRKEIEYAKSKNKIVRYMEKDDITPAKSMQKSYLVALYGYKTDNPLDLNYFEFDIIQAYSKKDAERIYELIHDCEHFHNKLICELGVDVIPSKAVKDVFIKYKALENELNDLSKAVRTLHSKLFRPYTLDEPTSTEKLDMNK